MKNNRHKTDGRLDVRGSLPQIGEYLKKRDEYAALPGRIEKGKMLVQYRGQWLTKEELNKVFPAPLMPDFKASLDNNNRTNLWMYQ